MDRYEAAIAEMSLTKGERMRRQSCAPSLCTQDSGYIGVRAGDGEREGLGSDPFLFL